MWESWVRLALWDFRTEGRWKRGVVGPRLPGRHLRS